MSKVFKKTSAFIPEKIFHPKEKRESGWKSVTIPAGQKETGSAGERGFSASDSVSETDFSIPAPSSQAHREHEAPAAEPEPETSGVQEQPDLDKLLEQAYNSGLHDGLQRAEEDFGTGAKALAMACEQINALRETILHNSMAEMQNLVLIIAEKIIRHSVTEQDRTIVDTVGEAIRQAVKSDEFVIHVHPEDLAIIKTKSQELIDSLSGLENIVVQADPAIERGGCKIDSSTSTVDATIAGQLRIIEERIKGKT